MPHKKNPITCERISGLARLLRGYAVAAMENLALWHERDISHSSVERVAIPDAFHLAHFMMTRLGEVLAGLSVDAARATVNVRILKDFPSSQAYLNALIAAGIDRSRAYAMVQAAGFRAAQGGCELWRELLNEPGIPEGFKIKEIPSSHFLRHLSALYQRAGIS